ncbi:MAG: hypothetical protein QM696_04220 [Steroidobacteraceae bacterium]
MSEKPETDDFEEDLDEAVLDADDVDLELTQELELVRQPDRGKAGVPAWRRLELLMEQKRTAELTSDFDDYEIDEPRTVSRGARR